MTKLLLLRIDADGNEVSGLQLANSQALPGGFSQDVHGEDKGWIEPDAEGGLHFAHRVYGALSLGDNTLPGLNQFSNAVVMGRISPTGELLAADFVENASRRPQLLVNGSRSIILANYGGGAGNVYRTLCLPRLPESGDHNLHNSVVMAVEYNEPKPMPVASFELQYLDQEGGLVRFNNTSINATTNTWVYGDNSPNSTLPSPVKGYNGGQNYLACLTATNLCGSSQACDNVVLGAAYTAHPPSAVQNSTVQLRISDLARAITAGTTFKLVRNGAADIPFTNLQFSATPAGTSGGNHPFHTWSGACDLTDAPLGPWGVVIARPGHAADTLHAAFTVLPNTGAGLVVYQTGLSSRASVFNMEGRREYRSAGGETLRGGRAAHEDGYLIAGTGEAPVGVPVISMLTHAANLTRFYERGYTTMRPSHASYTDLGQWREDNDFELPYNEGRDYVVSDNKAVRFHFLPQGGSSYQVKTRFAPGFGPGHQANLLWRNETYALAPVFGSDVLAGGNSIRSMIGLGQYLRLAAQDVLGMAVGTPGCHPCFTQAEEQVMAIYATDIANLPPVDPRFSLGQDPKIYDLRDVTADVLAQSMRTSCAPQLSTTTVDGITFQRIVDRALERLLLFGSQNPCLPPVEPPVPDGFNGSLLGNPRPPAYQPPLIRVGSSYNGPVFGAIPVSNPVATPPVPDLPETFWAPFEGVSTGEGTVIGTATIEVDGEKMTAPVQIKVEDDCTVTFTCFPPPPAGDKLEFEGENGHVSADAGPSLLGAYIDPDDDYALAQVVFLLELLPDENPHYAAALVAVFCMGDLRHPETTVGMNAQQVSDKWDQCLRDFHDAVNAANAPYAPGLQDMSPDIGPNVGQGCGNENTPQVRGSAPKPHNGDVAFEDGFGRYNCSYDPNEKTGPGDNEQEIWVKPGDVFNYMIAFENLPEASAPAQTVHIVDQLDTAFFDLGTVRLTGAQVGMRTSFHLPDSLPGGTGLRDMRPNDHMYLLLETALDEGGLLRWDFSALDTTTMQLVTDGLSGFLPPNDTTGAGSGMVTFSVQLKDDVVQGEFINNQASIVFDVNEPILTQVWRNKVDGIKPWSEVDELPAVTYTQQFNVQWQAGDSIGELRHLELWVSVDGAPYHSIGRMDGSSVQLTGAAGHHYRFYTIAVDMAGNREDVPGTGFDAETTIDESVSVGEEVTSNGPGLLCFPNPTSDRITLVADEASRGLPCAVYDVHGRQVLTQRLSGASTVLRTEQLAPGTYLIVVTDADGRRGQLRFVKE
ncbi:MAG: T9SS type A sorting domain-containing protein [Flavobacteriales bacterium]|nr:T9SS type A sorting domain-containing protein [Flavobacteriales bacterium]